MEVYCEVPIISVLKGIQSCSVGWWYCFILETRKTHMNVFIISFVILHLTSVSLQISFIKKKLTSIGVYLLYIVLLVLVSPV